MGASNAKCKSLSIIPVFPYITTMNLSPTKETLLYLTLCLVVWAGSGRLNEGRRLARGPLVDGGVRSGRVPDRVGGGLDARDWRGGRRLRLGGVEGALGDGHCWQSDDCAGVRAI